MSINRALEDIEYRSIIDDYLNHDRVSLLKGVPHHDSNRLDHSIKVSYLSYRVSKRLHLNYESVAKSGLLHDLYYEQIDDCERISDKVKLFMNEHPKYALMNARKICELTPLEENIILSHMWPASKYIPKHRESFVVSLIDKYVSFFEMEKRHYYKLSYIFGVYFILLTSLIFKS